ncbi:LGSN isoform 4 [Pan troglodytes]|uniref:LGSN isoform 4 n=2 Tax=Pan troglodytes TaxID=9598 RepID=A0A6D2X2Q8_PANTR|nr:LGSN isoform 4 [Pan troglodytes]
MNNEEDLLQEDSTRDEGNETEANSMNTLRRTRKKVTKPHICSTEVGETDMSNSNERIRNQMVCHKLGNTSKPVIGPGSAESHLSYDDKDSQDETTVIKPLPPRTTTNVPGGEFNPNSE